MSRRAITSQNGTAPKHPWPHGPGRGGAITSQNGTAPKPYMVPSVGSGSAITSQNGTAPKLMLADDTRVDVRLPVRTALLQNGSW